MHPYIKYMLTPKSVRAMTMPNGDVRFTVERRDGYCQTAEICAELFETMDRKHLVRLIEKALVLDVGTLTTCPPGPPMTIDEIRQAAGLEKMSALDIEFINHTSEKKPKQSTDEWWKWGKYAD